VLVGFAADGAEDGLERARAKRTAKKSDLVVYNDVSRNDIGFDAGENEVVVLSDAGQLALPKAPKREIAAAVLDEVERLLSNA
jgi:phosphopantothenoylcysteine synthetase/decarboxylase